MLGWKHTLKLEDVFHSDELTFEEKRDEIVRRIRYADYDDWNGRLNFVVDNLAVARDIPTFDAWWNEFYDWADVERVLVLT